MTSTVRSMSPLRLSLALGMSPGPGRSSYAMSKDGSPSSSVAGSVYGAQVLKEGYLERETKSGISRQKQWKRKCVHLPRALSLSHLPLSLSCVRARALFYTCVCACEFRRGFVRVQLTCAHSRNTTHASCPPPPPPPPQHTRFVVLTSVQMKYYATEEDYADGLHHEGAVTLIDSKGYALGKDSSRPVLGTLCVCIGILYTYVCVQGCLSSRTDSTLNSTQHSAP
jgi:hypothetical protein